MKLLKSRDTKPPLKKILYIQVALTLLVVFKF